MASSKRFYHTGHPRGPGGVSWTFLGYALVVRLVAFQYLFSLPFFPAHPLYSPLPPVSRLPLPSYYLALFLFLPLYFVYVLVLGLGHGGGESGPLVFLGANELLQRFWFLACIFDIMGMRRIFLEGIDLQSVF